MKKPNSLDDGKYQLPPRGLEGPWEELSDDKTQAKVMQVLRDLKPSTRDGMNFSDAGHAAAVDSVNAPMAVAHQEVLEHTPGLAEDGSVLMQGQGSEESMEQIGAVGIETATDALGM